MIEDQTPMGPDMSPIGSIKKYNSKTFKIQANLVGEQDDVAPGQVKESIPEDPIEEEKEQDIADMEP